MADKQLPVVLVADKDQLKAIEATYAGHDVKVQVMTDEQLLAHKQDHLRRMIIAGRASNANELINEIKETTNA